MGAVLHSLFQVVDFTQVLNPSVVNHSQSDKLLKRQRNFALAILHCLFDVDRHVDAFLAVGKRNQYVLKTRLVFVYLLDDRQSLLSDQLHLPVVRLQRLLKQLLGQVVEFAVFELVFVERHLDTHVRQHIKLQVVVALVFLMTADDGLTKVVHHVVDVDFQTLAEQCVMTLLVDGITLHVHHVVVVQQVFTHTEVVLFDLFLSLVDLLGDHRVLNHLAFLHAETVHDAGYTFRSEQTHQIVFKRDEEL